MTYSEYIYKDIFPMVFFYGVDSKFHYWERVHCSISTPSSMWLLGRLKEHGDCARSRRIAKIYSEKVKGDTQSTVSQRRARGVEGSR